jgi:hypothetical protein
VSTHQDDGSFARSAGGAAFRGALLIALAVVIGVVLLTKAVDSDAGTVETGDGGDNNNPAPATTEAPGTTTGGGSGGTVSTTSTTLGPPKPANEITVLVANGSGVQGAASAMSDQLKAAGYKVPEPDNAKGNVQATVVYYAPGFQREAATLAESIGANPATVQAMPNPVPTEDGDLRGAQIAVVLGPDLARPTG